mmetsp:Transcript_35658/g.60079  ORF Transcript_35658/g.60079 Transcript_35658/m.60079 type:complete len:240 (-) Transcript_35658:2803-3522(-)
MVPSSAALDGVTRVCVVAAFDEGGRRRLRRLADDLLDNQVVERVHEGHHRDAPDQQREHHALRLVVADGVHLEQQPKEQHQVKLSQRKVGHAVHLGVEHGREVQAGGQRHKANEDAHCYLRSGALVHEDDEAGERELARHQVGDLVPPRLRVVHGEDEPHPRARLPLAALVYRQLRGLLLADVLVLAPLHLREAFEPRVLLRQSPMHEALHKGLSLQLLTRLVTLLCVISPPEHGLREF